MLESFSTNCGHQIKGQYSMLSYCIQLKTLSGTSSFYPVSHNCLCVHGRSIQYVIVLYSPQYVISYVFTSYHVHNRLRVHGRSIQYVIVYVVYSMLSCISYCIRLHMSSCTSSFCTVGNNCLLIYSRSI